MVESNTSIMQQYTDLMIREGVSSFICGLKGSGKSYLARQIAGMVGAIVFDPLGEYGDLENVIAYKPTYRHYCKEAMHEVNRFFQYVKQLQGSSKTRFPLLIIDEISRIAPSKRVPPELLSEFNDLHRHLPYQMAAIYIARRPADCWSSLPELSEYIIPFRLRGKNDHIYLQNIAGYEVSKAVYALEKFEHLIIDPNRNFRIMPALGSKKVKTKLKDDYPKVSQNGLTNEQKSDIIDSEVEEGTTLENKVDEEN